MSHTRMLLVCTALLLAAPLLAQPVVRFGEDPEKVDPAVVVMEHKLKSQKVSLTFEEANLVEVVRFLRELSGLNILLDPTVTEELDEAQMQLSLEVKDLTLDSCINLICELKDLRRTYSNGILLITTKTALKKEVFFKVYDVRDVMFEIRDFPGPNIELVAADEGTLGADFIFDKENEGSNPFSDPDTLKDLITQNVAPDSWGEEGISISLRNGLLIVTSTREVHQEVSRFLDLLRSFR